MIPRLPYLEWMAERAPRAPHDLGRTALHDGDLSGDAVIPGRLEDRPTPPAGATLEHLVATEYEVQPEQLLITAGATHANVLAFAAAMDRDSAEILVESPTYQPLVETPRGLGADINRFDRGPTGALDPGAVESAIGEHTTLVTVSNRNNPTGALSGEEQLRETAHIAERANATLLVDEVYAPYVREARDGPFGGPSGASLENVILTGSLTKFFGFGDLRIGWLVGPPSFVETARAIAYHVPDVAGPSRRLAKRALFSSEDLAGQRRERLETNHGLLADFVADRSDLDGVIHDGAPYALLEPLEVSVKALVEAAWEEGVLIVPGEFFDAPGLVRVSATGPTTDVDVSLRRLGEVLTDV